MKLLLSFSAALLVAALLCVPATAQVTVVDFGAIQDNCCGDLEHTTFTTPVDAGDPAATPFLHANAAAAQANSTVLSLNGGATLSWTNVSAWNNNDGNLGVDPASSYFLHRGDTNGTPDLLDTLFTLTTANPTDQVSIDFIGGTGRDALITIDGVGTAVPITDGGATIAWTNVFNGTGTVTGQLDANTGDEGNVGAARITITPATVPEPTSLLLLGLGACTAVLRRRRS